MANDYLTKQLPTWMRVVELERGGERLEAIESSAIHLGETVSGRDVLDMTLLAHGRPYGDAFDRLRDSVRKHDPTFGCQADDLETAIAACAAVSALLARNSKSSSVAAQGVLSAKWLRLDPAVNELPELALATSRNRSEVLRRRRALPRPANKDFFKGFSNEISQDDPDDSVTNSQVQTLGTASKDMAEELQSTQRSLTDVLAARLDATDEEVQILWWAYSNYSELGKERWADLVPGTAALLSGIELGTKLVFEIELPSTEALLARLLGPNSKEPISLVTAVEAAASFLGSMELPAGHPLLPILSSVSEHRTLGGDPSWKGSVGRWEIDPAHSAEELDLACQAVREIALTGSISDG